MKLKSDFGEENLYPLWESFCKTQSWSNDLRLQGLNAGQLNLFEGPDYQDADFELDGKIYHGDVEIHRNTNEWYHHHHHLDRRYNSVQLHLVWHLQPEISVHTSDERNVITLDIKKLRGSSGYQKKFADCRISNFNPNTLLENLKLLSLKRLNYKVIRIKNIVKCNSYDQVLFLLLMRILGSPNNAANFEFLAASLPWEDLIKVRNQNNLSVTNWIEYFIYMSGLKSNFTNYSGNIPFSKLMTKASPLSISNWHISGQRPQNHPINHLKVLANWFFYLPNDSLYFTLKNIIIQRLSAEKLIPQFHKVFSPTDPQHRDHKKIEKNPKSKFRWGQSKLYEIIGNALIPFFYWEALMNSSCGFQEYLEDIYFTLPQLSKYAKLKKFDHLPINSDSESRKFYIYQGFLNLHQHYCIKGECHLCPLIDQNKEIDKNFENN
jgi:hypothetical protein